MTTQTITTANVLRVRVEKGLIFCNDLWQKMAASQDDAEFNRLSDQLDTYGKKLRELVIMLNVEGYEGCPLDSCKMANEESWICFACPLTKLAEVGNGY